MTLPVRGWALALNGRDDLATLLVRCHPVPLPGQGCPVALRGRCCPVPLRGQYCPVTLPDQGCSVPLLHRG